MTALECLKLARQEIHTHVEWWLDASHQFETENLSLATAYYNRAQQGIRMLADIDCVLITARESERLATPNQP